MSVEDLPQKDGSLLRPGVVWFNEVRTTSSSRGGRSTSIGSCSQHSAQAGCLPACACFAVDDISNEPLGNCLTAALPWQSTLPSLWVGAARNIGDRGLMLTLACYGAFTRLLCFVVSCRVVSCGVVSCRVVCCTQNLDDTVLDRIDEVLDSTDLLLIVGTSSVVYPAAGYAPQVAQRWGQLRWAGMTTAFSCHQVLHHMLPLKIRRIWPT
jgi:NAD-dependent SIR2 family protein deacetylase